jgi:type II secretory pathway pseudopilin PulG
MTATKNPLPKALTVAARERGLSLIEVLIAAGILLIVALGIVPLYLKAMSNNSAGNDYSQVANFAKSELERLKDLPLDAPDLTVPDGSTEREFVTFYSPSLQKWVELADVPVGETPTYTSTVKVTQCFFSGFTDGRCSDPQPGGTTDVHFKDIEVKVEGGRPLGGVLPSGKAITISTLKHY